MDVVAQGGKGETPAAERGKKKISRTITEEKKVAKLGGEGVTTGREKGKVA